MLAAPEYEVEEVEVQGETHIAYTFSNGVVVDVVLIEEGHAIITDMESDNPRMGHGSAALMVLRGHYDELGAKDILYDSVEFWMKVKERGFVDSLYFGADLGGECEGRCLMYG